MSASDPLRPFHAHPYFVGDLWCTWQSPETTSFPKPS